MTYGEKFSNTEYTIFKKGIWSLTQDGERTWALYRNGICVDPSISENNYRMFQNGFLLFRNDRFSPRSYTLCHQDIATPLFHCSGNVSMDDSNGIITFYVNGEPHATFIESTLEKVEITKDDQLGISI